ncbi:MAG: U32 family peptidase [Bacilli bacterium]|jgi:putative protease
MKILVMPNQLSQIDKLGDSAGFIVGIKDFSWYNPLELTIDELKDLVPKVKASRKEIFVSLNRLMYNQDIPLLKEYLLVMDEIGVSGIIYDDLSIYNLSKALNLKTPLIWFGIHLLTNQYTADYWYNKGVQYGIVSTEITLDHICDISANSKMLLMMYGYGYLPIFVSSRPLLSSYFEHINATREDKTYYMYEKTTQKLYPTYEDEHGTIILSSNIINTINELPILNDTVDYLILNSCNIPDDDFENIYNNYIKALEYIDNQDELDQIESTVSESSPANTDKGFLYKETVYRVKNDGDR